MLTTSQKRQHLGKQSALCGIYMFAVHDKDTVIGHPTIAMRASRLGHMESDRESIRMVVVGKVSIREAEGTSTVYRHVGM